MQSEWPIFHVNEYETLSAKFISNLKLEIGLFYLTFPFFSNVIFPLRPTKRIFYFLTFEWRGCQMVEGGVGFVG